uniref:BPTI/Kunitz inhibitor domain-containing protein n=1 Tax=Panagrolaimus davidi TaxID=227884 RepID=A0A914PQB6_9BILA
MPTWKCSNWAGSGIGQGTFPSGSNNSPGIGQGAQPQPGSTGGTSGIGHGTGSGFGNPIGQGAQPTSNNNNNNNIGQGARPSFGNGVNLFMRNNAIGNGVETSSSMPSPIGQGTNGNNLGAPIGDGASPNAGIGHGTNLKLTNLNLQERPNNGKVDIFNPFHPGPVKIGNGTWPAPAAPPSQLSIKDHVNGYAQMCDNSFGVNIKIPTSCGASDSCPAGFQCAGRFCCPAKETVCFQKSDSGKEFKEQEHVGRYAYEPELKTCLRFSYFGAEGNFNNFKTFNDCMRFCSF